jgi:ketosteroid isomerase-like protein
MGTRENKELAFDFFKALGSGDRKALHELVRDDFRWVVPQGAALHAGAHEGAANVFDAMLGAVGDSFVPGSQRTHFDLVVAEGDAVMCEARLHATAPDGRDYDNVYVFVFIIEDGRIAELREHVDTRYAAGFFGAQGGDA